MGTLSFVSGLLELLPSLISAGIDITNLLNSTNSVIKQSIADHRDPTDAEWAILDAQVDALRAMLAS